jgi:hypothetical protein
MTHSVPNTNRVATPWALTDQPLGWLCQVATAVVRGLLRLCGLGNATPELRMSREWLEEYARRTRKQPDGI